MSEADQMAPSGITPYSVLPMSATRAATVLKPGSADLQQSEDLLTFIVPLGQTAPASPWRIDNRGGVGRLPALRR